MSSGVGLWACTTARGRELRFCAAVVVAAVRPETCAPVPFCGGASPRLSFESRASPFVSETRSSATPRLSSTAAGNLDRQVKRVSEDFGAHPRRPQSPIGQISTLAVACCLQRVVLPSSQACAFFGLACKPTPFWFGLQRVVLPRRATFSCWWGREIVSADHQSGLWLKTAAGTTFEIALGDGRCGRQARPGKGARLLRGELQAELWGPLIGFVCLCP